MGGGLLCDMNVALLTPRIYVPPRFLSLSLSLFMYRKVTMSDRLAAERACKDANPIIDGRKANVNLAYLGAKPRGNIQAGKI